LQRRVVTRIALVCVAALGVGACSGILSDKNEGGFFSKPTDFFGKQDWGTNSASTVHLGPSGPVVSEDLVGADGRCGAPVAEAAPTPVAEPVPAATQPEQPPDRPVGSMAGDLASAPMPAATPVSVNPAQPEPPPGVYALHNAVDMPAMLPDGTLSDRSVSHAVVGRDVQLGRDPQGVVTVDLGTGERIDEERAIESAERGTEESGA